MKLMLSLTAMALCTYLLRGAWRMLVEVPDARQVWVPDAVDELLSRMLSAILILDSGVFLLSMAQAGLSSAP
jgi:hypothetical protein